MSLSHFFGRACLNHALDPIPCPAAPQVPRGYSSLVLPNQLPVLNNISFSFSVFFFFVYSALPPHTSFLFFFLFTTRLSIFNLRFPLTFHCPIETGWGCLHAGRAGSLWPVLEATICVPHCWAQPCPHHDPSLLSSPFSASGVTTLLQLWVEALETTQGTWEPNSPPGML